MCHSERSEESPYFAWCTDTFAEEEQRDASERHCLSGAKDQRILSLMHPTFLHLGNLVVPTVGLLAAIGLISALMLSLRTAQLAGLNPDRLFDAGLFSLLSAFVLSRLLLILTNLHTFLTYPLLLLRVPSLTPLGILLTILVTAIYLRRRGLPILDTLDAWAPCATLVWAFLAIGHLAEGSDPGMITSVPWAIPSSTNSAIASTPAAPSRWLSPPPESSSSSSPSSVNRRSTALH